MANTNLPADARIGVPIPADAPAVEPAQPLNDQYMAQARARASANERELAPLSYGKQAPGAEAATGEVQAPKPVEAAPGYPQHPPNTYKTADAHADFPAGSNSDSPTRGLPGTAPIPAARSKAPLAVVGGFGEASAEYFPLNGRELKTLVEQLLDEVYVQIQNDLRFHISQTYPRLAAKLTLTVEGEADDQGLKIERIAPPVERQSLDLAQQRCDTVCFVIKKQRREFDDKGEVETPADAMRHELGIGAPHKHKAPGPMGQIVDVQW